MDVSQRVVDEVDDSIDVTQNVVLEVELTTVVSQTVVEDVDDLKQEAREKAIKSAEDQAEEIADALDVSLDEVISYSEWTSSDGRGAYVREVSALAEGMGGGGEPPDIELGTEEFSMTVSITYQLAN